MFPVYKRFGFTVGSTGRLPERPCHREQEELIPVHRRRDLHAQVNELVSSIDAGHRIKIQRLFQQRQHARGQRLICVCQQLGNLPHLGLVQDFLKAGMPESRMPLATFQ